MKCFCFRLSKHERRKLFALKVEQEEEERRKQQELWRQHEQRCLLLGTDPRFTSPFDPNRGYQCIWNPQTGQWQPILPPNQNFQGMQTPQGFMPNIPPPGHQLITNNPQFNSPVSRYLNDKHSVHYCN